MLLDCCKAGIGLEFERDFPPVTGGKNRVGFGGNTWLVHIFKKANLVFTFSFPQLTVHELADKLINLDQEAKALFEEDVDRRVIKATIVKYINSNGFLNGTSVEKSMIESLKSLWP